MCMCRRTRVDPLDHTWRSQASLDTRLDTRVESSTPRLLRRWSYQNELCFDEWYFPALKNWSNIPIFCAHPFSDASSPLPSFNSAFLSSSTTPANNQRFYTPVDYVALQPDPADLSILRSLHNQCNSLLIAVLHPVSNHHHLCNLYLYLYLSQLYLELRV